MELTLALSNKALLRNHTRAAKTRGPQRQTSRRRLNQNQTRLGPEAVEELVRAYRDGASVRQLAARYGLHRTTVSAHLERHGVPR